MFAPRNLWAPVTLTFPPNLVIQPVAPGSGPTLRLTRYGDQIIVVWRSFDPGFNVEYTDSLVTPSWVAAAEIPVRVGDHNVLATTLTNSARYFRLRTEGWFQVLAWKGESTVSGWTNAAERVRSAPFSQLTGNATPPNLAQAAPLYSFPDNLVIRPVVASTLNIRSTGSAPYSSPDAPASPSPPARPSVSVSFLGSRGREPAHFGSPHIF